ncbi:unnamed protein product [Ostreobium quekettii]|uniref:Uncharacterized protein n=1 Tax=Ostreobium quekettii TaxID=121088 RepID=A0A8S1JAE3_9CHLO|nr:unnamed protein product [Ostreobium quekettii]
MKKQAELESGEAFNRVVPPDTVVGAELVGDELAQKFVSDINKALNVLKTTRDMSLNEVKLTITIEGPRERELRRLGLEKESGASRDEMAGVLDEVSRGKVPNDRIALKALAEEINDWTSTLAQVTGSAEPSGVAPTSGWREGQARPPIGRDKSEEPQSLVDMLPDWMGYSYLYLLSAVPLFIGVTIVVILFVNSLK